MIALGFTWAERLHIWRSMSSGPLVAFCIIRRFAVEEFHTRFGFAVALMKKLVSMKDKMCAQGVGVCSRRFKILDILCVMEFYVQGINRSESHADAMAPYMFGLYLLSPRNCFP